MIDSRLRTYLLFNRPLGLKTKIEHSKGVKRDLKPIRMDIGEDDLGGGFGAGEIIGAAEIIRMEEEPSGRALTTRPPEEKPKKKKVKKKLPRALRGLGLSDEEDYEYEEEAPAAKKTPARRIERATNGQRVVIPKDFTPDWQPPAQAEDTQRIREETPSPIAEEPEKFRRERRGGGTFGVLSGSQRRPGDGTKTKGDRPREVESPLSRFSDSAGSRTLPPTTLKKEYDALAQSSRYRNRLGEDEEANKIVRKEIYAEIKRFRPDLFETHDKWSAPGTQAAKARIHERIRTLHPELEAYQEGMPTRYQAPQEVLALEGRVGTSLQIQGMVKRGGALPHGTITRLAEQKRGGNTGTSASEIEEEALAAAGIKEGGIYATSRRQRAKRREENTDEAKAKRIMATTRPRTLKDAPRVLETYDYDSEDEAPELLDDSPLIAKTQELESVQGNEFFAEYKPDYFGVGSESEPVSKQVSAQPTAQLSRSSSVKQLSSSSSVTQLPAVAPVEVEKQKNTLKGVSGGSEAIYLKGGTRGVSGYSETSLKRPVFEISETPTVQETTTQKRLGISGEVRISESGEGLTIERPYEPLAMSGVKSLSQRTAEPSGRVVETQTEEHRMVRPVEDQLTRSGYTVIERPWLAEVKTKTRRTKTKAKTQLLKPVETIETVATKAEEPQMSGLVTLTNQGVSGYAETAMEAPRPTLAIGEAGSSSIDTLSRKTFTVGTKTFREPESVTAISQGEFETRSPQTIERGEKVRKARFQAQETTFFEWSNTQQPTELKIRQPKIESLTGMVSSAATPAVKQPAAKQPALVAVEAAPAVVKAAPPAPQTERLTFPTKYGEGHFERDAVTKESVFVRPPPPAVLAAAKQPALVAVEAAPVTQPLAVKRKAKKKAASKTKTLALETATLARPTLEPTESVEFSVLTQAKRPGVIEQKDSQGGITQARGLKAIEANFTISDGMFVQSLSPVKKKKPKTVSLVKGDATATKKPGDSRPGGSGQPPVPPPSPPPAAKKSAPAPKPGQQPPKTTDPEMSPEEQANRRLRAALPEWKGFDPGGNFDDGMDKARMKSRFTATAEIQKLKGTPQLNWYWTAAKAAEMMAAKGLLGATLEAAVGALNPIFGGILAAAAILEIATNLFKIGKIGSGLSGGTGGGGKGSGGSAKDKSDGGYHGDSGSGGGSGGNVDTGLRTSGGRSVALPKDGKAGKARPTPPGQYGRGVPDPSAPAVAPKPARSMTASLAGLGLSDSDDEDSSSSDAPIIPKAAKKAPIAAKRPSTGPIGAKAPAPAAPPPAPAPVAKKVNLPTDFYRNFPTWVNQFSNSGQVQAALDAYMRELQDKGELSDSAKQSYAQLISWYNGKGWVPLRETIAQSLKRKVPIGSKLKEPAVIERFASYDMDDRATRQRKSAVIVDKMWSTSQGFIKRKYPGYTAPEERLMQVVPHSQMFRLLIPAGSMRFGEIRQVESISTSGTWQATGGSWITAPARTGNFYDDVDQWGWVRATSETPERGYRANHSRFDRYIPVMGGMSQKFAEWFDGILRKRGIDTSSAPKWGAHLLTLTEDEIASLRRADPHFDNLQGTLAPSKGVTGGDTAGSILFVTPEYEFATPSTGRTQTVGGGGRVAAARAYNTGGTLKLTKADRDRLAKSHILTSPLASELRSQLTIEDQGKRKWRTQTFLRDLDQYATMAPGEAGKTLKWLKQSPRKVTLIKGAAERNYFETLITGANQGDLRIGYLGSSFYKGGRFRDLKLVDSGKRVQDHTLGEAVVMNTQENPTFIDLGHELAHSRRAIRHLLGKLKPVVGTPYLGTKPSVFGAGHRALFSITETSTREDNEEMFAIKHENRIRKAAGLRPRLSYRDDLIDTTGTLGDKSRQVRLSVKAAIFGAQLKGKLPPRIFQPKLPKGRRPATPPGTIKLG